MLCQSFLFSGFPKRPFSCVCDLLVYQLFPPTTEQCHHCHCVFSTVCASELRLALENSPEAHHVEDLMHERCFSTPGTRTRNAWPSPFTDTDNNHRLTVFPQSFKVTIMKRTLFASAIALMVCATAVRAQDNMSTTRLEAQQHTLNSAMGKALPKHEVNLIATLEGENPTMQAQAVQTMRELEQMFPKYSFKSLIAPLGAKLKDEDADPIVRRLAALALDELHSDAGDVAIKDVAGSSKDKGLQTLCNALLVRSQYK
jgi:hypothetical protein